MTIEHRLVGKLGGGLDWKAVNGSEFTASRPAALKATASRPTSVYLVVSGNRVSKIIRGTQILALNAGDTASSLPYQATEYAYLD